MTYEKYRGLSVVDGKWVYGFFYENVSNSFIGVGATAATASHKEIHHFINVRPETVCRYSGKNDKNGVEIYQDDIIRSINGKHFWEAHIRKINSNNLYAVETIHNYTTDEHGTDVYKISNSRSGTRNDVEYLSNNIVVIGDIYTVPFLNYNSLNIHQRINERNRIFNRNSPKTYKDKRIEVYEVLLNYKKRFY